MTHAVLHSLTTFLAISSLKEKGLNISDKGVTVKTNNRLTREDYIDGTQRAFINGIAAVKEAGSFGHADDIHRTPSSSPSMTARTSSKGSEHGSPAFNAVSRTDSFGSQKSDKKRSLFGGIRRKNST